MKRRILKFTVEPGQTAIDTEDEPRFLAVGTQGESVVVWVEATQGVGVSTALYPVMTGEDVPLAADYIGTTQVGAIVVHVYRRPTA